VFATVITHIYISLLYCVILHPINIEKAWLISVGLTGGWVIVLGSVEYVDVE
jgi:hypothetical protein